MRTRGLFCVGIIFLSLALGGFLWLRLTRIFPREKLVSGAFEGDLAYSLVAAGTKQPEAAVTPVPVITPILPSTTTESPNSALFLILSITILVLFAVFFVWRARGLRARRRHSPLFVLIALTLVAAILAIWAGPEIVLWGAAILSTPVATVSPSPTPLPLVKIETEWPRKMEVNCSDSVRVTLARTGEQTIVPTIELTGHAGLVATPVPVGTPGLSLDSAFGPEYAAFATANLVGEGFEISSLTTEEQSLEQPRITWDWSIKPRQSGEQMIIVNIEGQWRVIGDRDERIQRQIWRSPLVIQVKEPMATRGWLVSLTWISGIVGLVFSASPLYIKPLNRIRGKFWTGRQDDQLVYHTDADQYNMATIRSLLGDAFTVRELRRFCEDRPTFRPVLKDFSPYSGLNDMIDVLLEYCRTRALFPELLTEIEQYNPGQYEIYRSRLEASTL